MNKPWLYALAIVMMATAVLERTCGNGPEEFNPITEHSEIKAHFVEHEDFKIEWKYVNGNAYGLLRPHTDSVLIEDY